MGSPVDEDQFETEETDAHPLSPLPAARRTRQNPFLLVIDGEELGRSFKLHGEMVMGRGEQVAICLRDEGISRQHAKVVVDEEGKVQLVDLESRNGTFCNGERVTSCALQSGDRIQMGATAVLKLVYQDEFEEAAQQKLFEAATRDGLTGVSNKKYLLDMYPKEFAHAHRHNNALSLLMVDVDHFKRINDSEGHSVGDRVLQHLAKTLKHFARPGDIFARYGGEEFVFVLRRCEFDEAVQLAHDLRAEVENTEFKVGSRALPLTVSIGVATLREKNYPTPEALLDAADHRLLDAKALGRNRVCCEDGKVPPEVAEAFAKRAR